MNLGLNRGFLLGFLIVMAHSLSAAENEDKSSVIPADAICVLDYKMEECDGRTLKDASAFKNDAVAFALPYDDVFKWIPRKSGGHSLSIGNDIGSKNSRVGTFIPHSRSLEPQKFIIDFEIKPNCVSKINLVPILSAETSLFYSNKFKTMKSRPFHHFVIRMMKGNRIQLALSLIGDDGKIKKIYFCPKKVIPAGKFTKLRFVYDGREINGFFNGQLLGTRSCSGKICYDHPDYYPGHVAFQFGSGLFDGELDNLKIYDLEMKAKEPRFDVTIATDKYLNFFAPEETRKFSVGVANFTDRESHGVLSWSSMDHKDKIIASGNMNVKLTPESKNIFKITVPSELRGCFWLKCVYKDQSGSEFECEEQYAVGAIRNLKEHPDTSPFGIDSGELSAGRMRMPDLGMKWARLWLGWHYIEGKEGEWVWEVADRAVKYHNEDGKKIMVCLWGTPFWALNDKGKKAVENGELKKRQAYAFPCADPNKRREYIEKIVARYKDQVDVWEVWNEANCGYWRGSSEEFVDMLKQTHDIVRKLDPTAKVAGPSICTSGWDAFSGEILSMGAGKYMDLFLVHYLAGGLGRILPEKAEKEIGSTKDMLKVYGKKIPVWDGETGFYTATRNPKTNRPYSAKELAERTSRKEKYLSNKPGHDGFDRSSDEFTVSNGNVRKVVVCIANGVNMNFVHPVGLMRYEADLSWKTYRKGTGVQFPAIAWTAMVEKLNNADFVRRIDLGEEKYHGYIFKNRDSERNVAVLWCSEGRGDVILQMDPGNAKKRGTLNKLSFGILGEGNSGIEKFDIWGNPLQFKIDEEGGMCLSLSEAPVYLEGIGDEIKMLPPILLVDAPGFLSRGQDATIDLSLSNPLKESLKGTVKVISKPSLKVVPKEFNVELAPSGKLSRKVSFAIPLDFPGDSLQVDLRFNSKKRTENKSLNFNVTRPPFKCLVKSGQIVIDGKEGDIGWRDIPTETLEDEKQVVMGRPASYADKATILKEKEWYGPEDLSAKALICRDDKNLYLFLKVRDDFMCVKDRETHPYKGDGIELFIDGRPEKEQTEPGHTRGVCQIFLVPGDKSHPEASWLWGGRPKKDMKDWPVEVKSAKIADGYILEAKIPLSPKAFPNLIVKDGRVIGLDICLNDADHSGKRKSQISWRGTKNNYCDASKFGKIVFAKKE